MNYFVELLLSGLTGYTVNRITETQNVEERIIQCYENAENKLYKRYGKQFRESSFIANQENIDRFIKSFSYDQKNYRIEDININNFDNYQNDQNIVEYFFEFLNEEIYKDPELVRIIAEKEHIEEQKMILKDIKEIIHILNAKNGIKMTKLIESEFLEKVCFEAKKFAKIKGLSQLTTLCIFYGLLKIKCNYTMLIFKECELDFKTILNWLDNLPNKNYSGEVVKTTNYRKIIENSFIEAYNRESKVIEERDLLGAFLNLVNENKKSNFYKLMNKEGIDMNILLSKYNQIMGYETRDEILS